jgi:transposase-like protein
VSPSKQTFTFPISSELKKLLQEVKRQEGIPEAEQIRRGLRLWFESKGYRFEEDSPKTAARRGGTRRTT